MFKSKLIGLTILLVVLLIALITVAAVFRLDLLFTGRNGYLEYTAHETQTVWKPPLQAIASDFANNWCNSPSICQPEEVRVFQIASNRAIIVLQMRYLRGDSVDASQMRIELVRVEEVWKVEWAGVRWRCDLFRGNNGPGWTTEPCP
jgi:hypothetical protein